MNLNKTQDRQTEGVDPRSAGIDASDPLKALKTLHDGQLEAANAVGSVFGQISEASSMAANCLSSGGTLAYVGAGSSGLLAVTDGLELPGTFGIDPHQIKLILAGGLDEQMILDSASEDDAAAATAEIAAARLGSTDCALLVSASGFTPFTVAALKALQKAGTATIALANNAHAPLLTEADVAICLPTPPEILSGSTRMGAGTAQKIALNMFSTMVGMYLGHVHDGYMVNVVADNEKLKQRAVEIVSKISGCPQVDARAFVGQAGGLVKPAVLLAKGARSLEDANRMLSEHGGRLRECFEALARSPG